MFGAQICALGSYLSLFQGWAGSQERGWTSWMPLLACSSLALLATAQLSCPCRLALCAARGAGFAQALRGVGAGVGVRGPGQRRGGAAPRRPLPPAPEHQPRGSHCRCGGAARWASVGSSRLFEVLEKPSSHQSFVLPSIQLSRPCFRRPPPARPACRGGVQGACWPARPAGSAGRLCRWCCGAACGRGQGAHRCGAGAGHDRTAQVGQTGGELPGACL